MTKKISLSKPQKYHVKYAGMWSRLYAAYEIETLNRAYSHLQSAIKKSQGEFSSFLKSFQDEQKEEPEEVQQLMYDYYNEESELHYDAVPRIVNNAFVIVYWTHLEHALDRLCNSLHKRLKLRLTPDDLNHRGVRRSVEYLTKVAGSTFDMGSHLWERMLFYNALRNVIAHKNGRDLDGKFQKKLGGKNGISINGKSEIVISTVVIEQMQAEITDFMKAIGRSVPEQA